MPQGNAKGVLTRLAASALALGVLATPQAAFAVKVPDSVIYDASATDNKNLNHMYSLDGIKYNVYTNQACTAQAKVAGTSSNAVLTISYTAGADYAQSNVVELEPDTYWVREVESSVRDKGLAYNDTAQSVTVTSDNTEDSPATPKTAFTDPVVQVDTGISGKIDAELAEASKAQGDGNLANCVIRVAYFDKEMPTDAATVASRIGEAKRVWYFKTDANGKLNFKTAAPITTASTPSDVANRQGSWGKSDPLYITKSNQRVFLLGSYYVDEVCAPEGYDLQSNPEVLIFQMDNGNLSATRAKGTFEPKEKANTPNVGQITISKVDAEAKADGKGNITQGDSDHAAVFTITNASENAIIYHDASKYSMKADPSGVTNLIADANDEGQKVAVGAEVPVKLVCERQSNGDWVSNTVILPYGTYTIREESGGTGMLTDESWSKTVELHDGKQVEDIKLEKENTVVRSGLKLTKVDSDTVAPRWLFTGGDVSVGQLVDEIALGQGNASLVGAEFTIKNVSQGPVKVEGTWYDPNADIMTITTKAAKTESGKDIVVASTPSNASLPYGTYEVRETKAPEGYNPIVGLIGGEPVVAHPTQSENGIWYVTGWDPSEVAL